MPNYSHTLSTTLNHLHLLAATPNYSHTLASTLNHSHLLAATPNYSYTLVATPNYSHLLAATLNHSPTLAATLNHSHLLTETLNNSHKRAAAKLCSYNIQMYIFAFVFFVLKLYVPVHRSLKFCFYITSIIVYSIKTKRSQCHYVMTL